MAAPTPILLTRKNTAAMGYSLSMGAFDQELLVDPLVKIGGLIKVKKKSSQVFISFILGPRSVPVGFPVLGCSVSPTHPPLLCVLSTIIQTTADKLDAPCLIVDGF